MLCVFSASSHLRTLLLVGIAVAVIAGVIIVILLINCVINRCPLRKRAERQHNAERAPDDPMLPPETTVIYRPGKAAAITTNTNVPVVMRAPASRTPATAPRVDTATDEHSELQPLQSTVPSSAVHEPDDTRPTSVPPTYDELFGRVSRVDM